MSKNKMDRRIPALEPFFESVLICNDKQLRPYIETFVIEPENISQEKLGTIFGIFEIADESEESSYIVNYLISVIKKEYFLRTKGGAFESFESALHKANLALSKLAEHGSVSWIGKFNGIIMAIEKSNVHLSQTGNASAFLLRSKIITEISEGLAPEGPEPNPLKTFVNISSGRLETGDKFILLTANVFDIFSIEEIKKSALRFNQQDFIQFLRTALGNELQQAAALVVDLKEKVEAPVPSADRKTAYHNAFSQNAFAKTKPKEETIEALVQEEAIEDEMAKERGGHLYIRESETSGRTGISAREIWIATLEKFQIVTRPLGQGWRRVSRGAVSTIKNKLRKKPASGAEVITEIENQEIIMPSAPKKFFQWNRAMSPVGKFFHWLAGLFSKLIPNLSKLKNVFLRLDYSQRLYVILIILAIIFVPFFAVKFFGSSHKQAAPPPIAEPVAPPIPLEADKNVVRLENLADVYTAENIQRVINLKGKFFAVSGNEIIDLENKEAFGLPDEFKNPQFIAGMDDLNLIFIFQDRKAIAFSPVSKKFQPNNITIPENAEIAATETYLTYLYLVDTKANQIYRYPRAEGGFGEKVDWKKDDTDLAGVTGMAINENLFLANGENILKFFQGKKQDFNIEETATPIKSDQLYTRQDLEDLFVLDQANSRIVRLDKDGKIISQFYNSSISEAKSFSVNTDTKTVYLNSENWVKSFQME
ncbi:MAG: hypothetical protein NTZ97_03455 [Candidatus Moranbacteria bacterium]|nr:hypothetical protein [Candidatus Moranbacteria bacterium]